MATYLGLDLFSTGHQASISQVPLILSLSFKQRPVLTPAAQTSQKRSQRAATSSPCLQGTEKPGAFHCHPEPPSWNNHSCCSLSSPKVLWPSHHRAEARQKP